jgi:hyperosmotically inducible periplasmic protein
MMSVPTRTMIVLAAAALAASLVGCHRTNQVSAADLAAGRSDHSASPATSQPAALPPTAAASAGGAGAAAARETPSTPAAASTRAGDTRAMGAPSSTLASAIASAAPDRVDDASITRQVGAAIRADQELRRLTIDVDTENGIVTLSGPTPTASAKAHADEVARTVKGVVSVNNQLTLPSG